MELIDTPESIFDDYLRQENYSAALVCCDLERQEPQDESMWYDANKLDCGEVYYVNK